MDVLESHILAAQQFLASMIVQHRKHRYWHYGITLPATNPHSLAEYLRLNNEQYTSLMCTLGLMKTIKKNGNIYPAVCVDAWERFIIDNKLDSIYFDRSRVSKVPVNSIDESEPFIPYNGYWIGMGCPSSLSPLPNPSSQFTLFNNPPRVPNRNQKLYELKMVVNILAGRFRNDDECNDDNEEDDNDNSPEEVQRSLQEGTTAASVGNITSFLVDYKMGKRSLEATSDIIIEVIKEAIQDNEKKRAQVFITKVAYNGNDEEEEEELIFSQEQKYKKYQLLIAR